MRNEINVLKGIFEKKLFLLQVVLKLLEEGAPFVLDSDGQTALHQAAAGGHADTVAALILGGCDASVQDFVSLFFSCFFCSFLRHFFSPSLPLSFYFL